MATASFAALREIHPSWRRSAASQSAYYDRFTAPLNRAVIQLVQTPAPNLPALLAKIEIIREHELDSHDDMPCPPIELLREDVKRLGKE